jgi:hypothetical protein
VAGPAHVRSIAALDRPDLAAGRDRVGEVTEYRCQRLRFRPSGFDPTGRSQASGLSDTRQPKSFNL